MTISRNSLWLDKNPRAKIDQYPSLKADMDLDVAIIGGGIAGVTSAYLLSKSKLKVALFEKDQIGSGATGFTTAMITQYVDTDLATLIDSYGKTTTKKIWESGGTAISTIEKIVKKEKIDCEFMRVPYYVYAENKKQLKGLESESETAEELEIPLTLKTDPTVNLLPTHYPYLTLANQAKFHPILYMRGLAKAVAKNGVSIYENSEISEVEKKEMVLKTKNGNTVRAKHIIIATYNPLNAPLSLYFRKGQYTTYMLVAKIKKGFFKEALYQDMNNPYHYFRIDSKKTFDQIIIGGEDHRSQIPVSEEKSFKALEEYLKKILVGEKYTTTHKWSGPILEPVDGLPSIGPMKDYKNIFYATGFSGTGMTYGTLSGMILSDLVLGKKNELYSLFRADRHLQPKALWHKTWDYTEEFFGGAFKNILK